MQRLTQINRRFGTLGWLALSAVVLLAALVSLPSMIARGAPVSSPTPAVLDQIPCTDSRGCPDIVVDEGFLNHGPLFTTETFAEDDCAVIEGMVAAGTRRLLRFDFLSPNRGPGDLIIGDPVFGPNAGFFEFALCHQHLHFRQYADYRLWTPAGYLAWQALRAEFPDALPGDLLNRNKKLASELVRGDKRGFCVIDVLPALPGAGPATYVRCGFFVHNTPGQGISVGWADLYDKMLDGQWIDVTGLPHGNYVLEAEVNPERLFQETDYTNNASAAAVTIR